MQADEKKCPQCAETVKPEAKICRFCGHSFEGQTSSDLSSPPSSSPPADSKRKIGLTVGCLIIVGFLVAVLLFGGGAGQKDNTIASIDSLPSANEVAISADDGEKTESVGLFGPRANAARSAKQYLEMTGFSRAGLIDQLSSGAGNGYDVADATAAVDSLSVDWNEQAARSAKQYLSMTGFSCSGLIEQLSSGAGSKYTKSQARFGAQQAGAC